MRLRGGGKQLIVHRNPDTTAVYVLYGLHVLDDQLLLSPAPAILIIEKTFQGLIFFKIDTHRRESESLTDRQLENDRRKVSILIEPI